MIDQVFESPSASCELLPLAEAERAFIEMPPEPPSVPSGLDEMVPGPVLGAFLSIVEQLISPAMTG
ncbi:MAG: hypothetical protein OEM32_06555 [Acidimicrobiia bacterium]|nr:hypothetical protein [Acidimicrobiia bacterium]